MLTEIEKNDRFQPLLFHPRLAPDFTPDPSPPTIAEDTYMLQALLFHLLVNPHQKPALKPKALTCD